MQVWKTQAWGGTLGTLGESLAWQLFPLARQGNLVLAEDPLMGAEARSGNIKILLLDLNPFNPLLKATTLAGRVSVVLPLLSFEPIQHSPPYSKAVSTGTLLAGQIPFRL
ncbi:hypothetical protein N7G274_002830 [Stereocaulon virgatum]|uniref:Uncharacterized protein n=1 Tax=Stereocaulon virgatum TaxID=373712 RepID=A0ABR4AHX8_9LECA